MKSTKEMPKGVKILLEIRQELFGKIVHDLSEMYTKGRFSMAFVGSAFRSSFSKEEEDILLQKYKLSRSKLYEIIYAFIYCVHWVLSNEVEEVSKKLSATDAQEFQKRIKLVSEVIEKDTSIKNSYYVYNLSKSPFFSKMEWEAGIKVFHSPQEYIKEPPRVPAGRVKIELDDPKTVPPETLSFAFEISLRDVENMIKSLEDFRKALVNLENVEIVPRKANN